MKLRNAKKVNKILTKSLKIWIKQKHHNYTGLVNYKKLINFYIKYSNKLIWKK